MKNLLKYSEAFAHLRRERSPGVWAEKTAFAAPHKPLLLLSVIDLFARGEITSSLIEISSVLEERFASYWVSVTGRTYVDDIVHPFFALKNERQEFWELVPRQGKNELLKTRPDWVRLNLDHLKQCVRGARLGKELVHLFQIAESRLTLREVLVNTYFSAATKLELAALIPSIPSEYTATIRKQSTLNRILRDSSAAISIKRLYDYSCQICQTRLTVGKEAYAEAAHIKPLGLPHNGPDYSTNLLCLCPNHHVLFDLGGVSLTDDLKLIPGGASIVVRSSHTIDRELLRYHRDVIYAR
ncbi:MAG: HNH endonuclease [Acidobacteria bacterium]|nr:HNH endonuclease [Acidobacteriota bacterium]